MTTHWDVVCSMFTICSCLENCQDSFDMISWRVTPDFYTLIEFNSVMITGLFAKAIEGTILYFNFKPHHLLRKLYRVL